MFTHVLNSPFFISSLPFKLKPFKKNAQTATYTFWLTGFITKKKPKPKRKQIPSLLCSLECERWILFKSIRTPFHVPVRFVSLLLCLSMHALPMHSIWLFAWTATDGWREHRFTLENVVSLRTDNENRTHKKQIMTTHKKCPMMKRRSPNRSSFFF